MSKQRDLERRALGTVELRSMHGGRAIGGYAAVFNSPSKDLGGFIEIVEKTAFNMSRGLGYPGVVCRAEHSDILGSTRGKTLELNIDSVGLDYTCQVAETRAGDDTLALVGRGDLASSFAFKTTSDEWRNNGQTMIRHLIEVQLQDVSCVGIPAYDASTVSLRSLAAQCDAPLDDVIDLYRRGQLIKLLTRSDNGHREVEGYDKLRARLTGRQALVKLYEAKDGPSQRLTPAKARAELTRMAMPQPTKTTAQRKAELTRLARPVYQILGDE